MLNLDTLVYALMFVGYVFLACAIIVALKKD